MKQQQQLTENTPFTFKKKVYSKPVLTILGEVSKLTAGGSKKCGEYHDNGKKHFDNGNKNPRC